MNARAVSSVLYGTNKLLRAIDFYLIQTFSSLLCMMGNLFLSNHIDQ